jgi:hypothetical protein
LRRSRTVPRADLAIGRRGAFAGMRRGGRPPLASKRALQYSQVLVTTFGIALSVPANLISHRCSGCGVPSASARS